MSAPLDGIKQLEANDAGPEEENIRVNHYTDPSFIAPDSAIVCLGNCQPVGPGTGWGARVFVKLGVLWLWKMNQAQIYT